MNLRATLPEDAERRHAEDDDCFVHFPVIRKSCIRKYSFLFSLLEHENHLPWQCALHVSERLPSYGR